MHSFYLKKTRTHQWISRNQQPHPSGGVQITLSGETVQKVLELFSSPVTRASSPPQQEEPGAPGLAYRQPSSPHIPRRKPRLRSSTKGGHNWRERALNMRSMSAAASFLGSDDGREPPNDDIWLFIEVHGRAGALASIVSGIPGRQGQGDRPMSEGSGPVDLQGSWANESCSHNL